MIKFSTIVTCGVKNMKCTGIAFIICIVTDPNTAYIGDRGSTVVKVLRYNQKVAGSISHGVNFSLT
jgi:hypothetical protein